ncbi:DUF3558 domain-containing protein [Rhodococcoides fascians A25f]|uniref:DUF3558 family protein n=1 Tax=Rhodococcoides fascians TaxID=1828 RepID=UPI0009B84C01|nr:DUF3558 family protein [Rhodococcus fascians]QII04186.1 DUF3558 domain-containing protein [Rhodococcus fascians A25f]
MRGARRSVPAAVALVLLTGCSGATAGQPSPGVQTSSTVAAPTTPWDPCSIPDEAIERAGLNVETKESGVFGRDQNGFKICGWESQPSDSKYYFSIFVGLEDIDYIDDPSKFDRLRSVRVGTRDATQYQQVGADASFNCGAAFTVGAELIMTTLNTSALVDLVPYDPCTELSELTASLDSELPN